MLSLELSRAKDHLRAIFVRLPVDTRRSVCHAASIISIARECTIFTPCETMRVFNGCAFLLAFAKFSSPVAWHDDSTIQGSPTVRLDELPWQRSEEANNSLRRWVEHGGVTSLDPVDDISAPRNFELLKQMTLKAMQDLRVWGLARKFQRILQNFD